jgi:hypothetical protein
VTQRETVGDLAVTSTAHLVATSELVRVSRYVTRRCPSADRAVRFYARRMEENRARMGAGGDPEGRVARVLKRPNSCPRFLAHVLQRKAHALRVRVEKWIAYQWSWRYWLPAKWVRIGICETRLNWKHDSGTYQGAFGFHRSSWDAFRGRADRRAGPYPSEAFLATPRQQYEVALAIWRAFGFSGWGCRGA